MNAPRLRLSAPARPMAVARAKSGLHNTTRSPWRHTRVVNAPPVVPHRSSGRGGTAPAAEAEAEAGANPTPTPTPSTTTPRVETPLRETIPLMLFALAMGVTNRVLYRVSLVPMADYTYFLSLLLSFGYVTVFSTILLLRVRAGIVPPAMLFSLPFARLAVVGIIDSAGLLLGLTGASRLPGTVLPILGQTMLLWQLAFSHVFLGRRFSRNQYLGVFLVFMGVVIVGYPVSGAAALHYPSAALMVLSMACPALSTMVKERFFATAQRILGKPVDIFVVNTVGSWAQALATVCLLPVTATLQGLSMHDLPAYIERGTRCLMGIEPTGQGAPLIPLIYLGVNLSMNVVFLQLLRQTSGLTLSLVASAIVPLTVFAFTFNLPLLGAAPPIGVKFVTGCLIVGAGIYYYLLSYNATGTPSKGAEPPKPAPKTT